MFQATVRYYDKLLSAGNRLVKEADEKGRSTSHHTKLPTKWICSHRLRRSGGILRKELSSRFSRVVLEQGPT